MENEYMIQVSRLCKTYGTQSVLRDVSFSFSKKGIHGILGPRGAGKSTLMDLLAGCVSADNGEILLGGQRVAPEQVGLRGRIGYVAELPDFYQKMTVLETLDFVGAARGGATERRYRQIKEALELTNLESVQNRLTARLTSAEKKRLSLAAALLGNTEVVLFDEANTADLDLDIKNLIRMLGKHKTVVLASADLALIRELCEDVVILFEGSVFAWDTVEGLEEKLSCNRILHVSVEGDAEGCLSLLSEIDGVLSCTAVSSEKNTRKLSIRIEYAADSDAVTAAVEALRAHGGKIGAVKQEEMSLEKAYASLEALSADQSLSTRSEVFSIEENGRKGTRR